MWMRAVTAAEEEEEVVVVLVVGGPFCAKPTGTYLL